MTLHLQSPDMARITRLALDLARRETEAAQTAILWTVRNCLTYGDEDGAADPERVVAICDALRADAGGPARKGGEFDSGSVSNKEFCRALGAFCGVFGTDLPDPSGGAVRLHRHDAVPQWANNLDPSALIGSYFFYNDPSLRTHWDLEAH